MDFSALFANLSSFAITSSSSRRRAGINNRLSRTKLTNNSHSYNRLGPCYSQIALVAVASA
jgi:hypothetical protein